jgi:hypothetical protein
MLETQSRPVATTPDSDFTLSIDEALERYAKAGHPRTPRSVQRYCAKGHLEARLIETSFGEKWLITSDSVEKHIAYIDEVTPSTGRDMTRPVATSRDIQIDSGTMEEPVNAEEPRHAATDLDLSRRVATNNDNERHVSRLEGENEFLRSQVLVKDTQIKDLTERARETNHLIAGLQHMLSPLLGSAERRNNADRAVGDSQSPDLTA